MGDEVILRPVSDADWDEVLRIYGHGIETRNATFEAVLPELVEFQTRWIPGRFWVAEVAGVVAGWAALLPGSGRHWYHGVAEDAVYVAPAMAGRGIGRLLIDQVIKESKAAGVWTLQAHIFPENAASLALHYGAGFRLVGRRERFGEMDGVWRDVLLLERRA